MNPKRRFFQIHLSTAVVLMLVAGVLVWANVRERIPEGEYGQDFLTSKLTASGWPFECYWKPRPETADQLRKIGGHFENVWDNVRAAFNFLIALTILLSVWQLCEWLVRRRAARKANE